MFPRHVDDGEESSSIIEITDDGDDDHGGDGDEEQQQQQQQQDKLLDDDGTTTNEKLKLAVAMALLRSNFRQNQPPINNNNNPSSSSDHHHHHSSDDVTHWKRKAKERKQELISLKQQLHDAQDAQHFDLYPQSASCKCYFFNNLANNFTPNSDNAPDGRFNDVLRRRFLRQVRMKEQKRRRTCGSGSTREFSLSGSDQDVIEQLSAAVDFLVDLCDSVYPVVEANFANSSHQAVDFILASLNKLLSMRLNMETIEGIISSLIMRLTRRMCAPLPKEETNVDDVDPQFYIQHLIRKLGSVSYVGQRTILSVSQRISELAESLLFMDPFNDAFPTIHNCMFLMIQLIEFLVSDYLLSWSKDDDFDKVLCQEWVTSVLHARRALELLENRNGLYVLYMDRVTGELAKLVAQVSSLEELHKDIMNNLFR